MRSDEVVVRSPGLDDGHRLASAAEPFEGETLVAELPVEALVGAVLPGLPQIDVRRLDVRLGEP
jgi:hypothetical protein